MFQNPELKIDKEFEDLLLTDTDCTPLFVPFFYKKIKKVKGIKQQCPACNSKASGNVEGSIDCPSCEGLGFQFVEGIYNGWFYRQSYMVDRSISTSVPLKMATANFNKLILTYDKGLKLYPGDIILRPELDENGRISIPVEVRDMYKISSSEFNSSNQKMIEYNSVELTSTFGDFFRGVLRNGK